MGGAGSICDVVLRIRRYWAGSKGNEDEQLVKITASLSERRVFLWFHPTFA